MKLCRFDLADSPGSVRSGFVHDGKIYETNGSNPVAVHEPSETRLLAPIGKPPSLRLFSATRPAYANWIDAGEAAPRKGLHFTYINPSLLAGPNSAIPLFGPSNQIACKPCLAALVDDAGKSIDTDEAEKHVLGLTMGLVFYAVDLERDEMAKGVGISASHDVGIAIGPALTTPDELEESRTPEAEPLGFELEISVLLDGEEILKIDTSELEVSLADAVASASASCPLVAGDLILLAIGSTRTDAPLKEGAEIRMLTDKLGHLAARYG